MSYLANKFDFGLSTGLGVDIPISGSIILKIEVRNNLGLLPFWEVGDAKPNSIVLIFRLNYRLGSK